MDAEQRLRPQAGRRSWSAKIARLRSVERMSDSKTYSRGNSLYNARANARRILSLCGDFGSARMPALPPLCIRWVAAVSYGFRPMRRSHDAINRVALMDPVGDRVTNKRCSCWSRRSSPGLAPNSVVGTHTGTPKVASCRRCGPTSACRAR